MGLCVGMRVVVVVVVRVVGVGVRVAVGGGWVVVATHEALVLVFVANPLFESYVVSSDVSFVISIHVSLVHLLRLGIAHFLHYLYLLWGPFVKTNTLYFRNVCSHGSVNARTADAYKDTDIGGGPSWGFCSTIHAIPVLW